MAKIDCLGERGKGRQERGDGLTKLRIEIGEDYDGWLVGWLVGWVIRPYAMLLRLHNNEFFYPSCPKRLRLSNV